MNRYTVKQSVFLMVLAAAIFSMVNPFLFGRTGSLVPVGKMTGYGQVTIGGISFPAGTVVFSGKSVATHHSPAFVVLKKAGSVILEEESAATFIQNNGLLSIQHEKGTILFNFLPGERVCIQAGTQRFTASENGSAGKISVNADGAAAVLVASGNLNPVVNTAREYSGQLRRGFGYIKNEGANGVLSVQGEDFWSKDSVKNQTLIVNGKNYRILSNTGNQITIRGKFDVKEGEYAFSIADPGSTIKRYKYLLVGGAAAGGLAIAVTAGKGRSKSD